MRHSILTNSALRVISLTIVWDIFLTAFALRVISLPIVVSFSFDRLCAACDQFNYCSWHSLLTASALRVISLTIVRGKDDISSSDIGFLILKPVKKERLIGNEVIFVAILIPSGTSRCRHVISASVDNLKYGYHCLDEHAAGIWFCVIHWVGDFYSTLVSLTAH